MDSSMFQDGEGVKNDYSKALTYFSLAAQHGSLVAVYYLAQMHQNGLGTMASCVTAVQLYKKVAEKGSWAGAIEQAHKYYQQGDFDKAVLLYEKAAEQGYEVAQSNAAWMYDRGLVSWAQDDDRVPRNQSLRYKLALEYYKNAAEQKYPLAHLKIGDYYYYGCGTTVNVEKAANYYQMASAMRNAQATFNLGYMHQHGLGLPKDLHLAKRHYDMALQYEQDAYIAVYAALVVLGMDFIREGYFQAMIQEMELEPYLAYFRVLDMEWDTVLILTLAIAVGVLIMVRNRHV